MRDIVISVLLPGDGGQPDFSSAIKAMIATATDPASIEFLSYSVSRNPSSEDRVDVERMEEVDGTQCALVSLKGPPKSFVSRTNDCAARSTGDIVLLWFVGPRIATPGWDDALRGAFSAASQGHTCLALQAGGGGFGTILGSGTEELTLPATIALTRNWIEAADQFLCPASDDSVSVLWVCDIAFRLGRLHPVQGLEIDLNSIKGPISENGHQRIVSGLVKYQQSKAYRAYDARRIMNQADWLGRKPDPEHQPILVDAVGKLAHMSYLFDEVQDGSSAPLSFE